MGSALGCCFDKHKEDEEKPEGEGAEMLMNSRPNAP